MSYTIFGPFSDGVAPGVDASFLNALETYLASINSAATDSSVSSSSGNVVATSYKAGSTSGTYKIGGNMGSGHQMHFQDSTGYEPFRCENGGVAVAPNNSSTPSFIKVGAAFGVKKASGTKLMEAKSNGDFIISGGTYWTDGGTFNFSSGGSFDGFDFAEVFRVDQVYEDGAVVCPSESEPIPYHAGERILPLMTRCTHDGCPLAHVISRVPGFCAGSPNYPGCDEYDENKPLSQAVALVGRVFAQPASEIAGRVFLCSDGAGKVRVIQPGETAMAIGISLAPALDGMVPLIVRPCLVRGGI